MRANPGGYIEPKEVLGRDDFIAMLWRVLEKKSIYLGAERRYGKTRIIQKMCLEPHPDWHAEFMELEGVHTADEFAEAVSHRAFQYLGVQKRTTKKIAGFLHTLAGIELGGVLKFPEVNKRPANYWKILLQSAVEDVIEQQSGKRLVFFWDEMPYMIDAIAKRQGETTAMEILDVCRSIRQSPQTGPDFRMVLTGSIGLHHVLSHLKEQGYSNAPINDMEPIEVPPLAPADAAELARRLMAGEKLKTADAAAAAELVAAETGNIPYYIHYVVAEMSNRALPADEATIKATVQDLITGVQDKWSLRHFRDRISTYYPNDEGAVLAILDCVAARDKPISIQELLAALKHGGPVDAERVRELIRLLQHDHYVHRDNTGAFTFFANTLRRWWRFDRGL
jgi:hypothetical protein